ncbi:DUF3800 domain-containing protein [Streptococcus suis]|uniref:DUF3800 domain-containing protein n=1 Tax=Streptococcus suis TaxID=1307 RepID=UPI0005CF3321|nr:DUF3800 domain-containing protein [Streptococcus suis]MBM7154273.1 DUF3800 domain-containing protein [Streptococcus suis]MDG4504070.1 DUF3800 domain-containing protein [Streptococcus suis]NQH54647.1 DUF3800 domain-containing protein [Streptococcus suis]CYV16068.1 Protein of uncharacterised function (DUF3800) [Streptococcus suis]HEL1634681.1 DUF3800 domain-containing protein [Streptococcus suis]
MKSIYLDEAGNTGGISLNKNEKLNIGEGPQQQGYFVYGGVVLKNKSDKRSLEKKYQAFKNSHDIYDTDNNGKAFIIDKTAEIKGSNLFTRRNNQALEDFIGAFLNERDFYLNIYDKKFYIVTQILACTLGFEYRDLYTKSFYEMANTLLKDESYFEVEQDFLKATSLKPESIVEINNQLCLSFSKLKKIASNYPDMNVLVEKLNGIISDDSQIDSIRTVILSKGTYQAKPSFSNLINLTALGELLLELRKQRRCSRKNCEIKIDPICDIDDVILDELRKSDLNIIKSEGSDVDIMIQLADNVVSALYKSFNNVIKKFRDDEKWAISNDNIWQVIVFSLIINKIGTQNIKFTLSIDEWAFCLALSNLNFGISAINQQGIQTTVEALKLLNDYSDINERFSTAYENAKSRIIQQYNNQNSSVFNDLVTLLGL